MAARGFLRSFKTVQSLFRPINLTSTIVRQSKLNVPTFSNINSRSFSITQNAFANNGKILDTSVSIWKLNTRKIKIKFKNYFLATSFLYGH